MYNHSANMNYFIYTSHYKTFCCEDVHKILSTRWMCGLSPSIALCIFSKKTKTKLSKKYTKWSWSQSSREMASWLVHSTLKWVVQVWAQTGDNVLCSWAKHITCTVSGSTQVYKWVLVNLILRAGGGRGITLWWTSIPFRGSRNTHSCFMLLKLG